MTQLPRRISIFVSIVGLLVACGPAVLAQSPTPTPPRIGFSETQLQLSKIVEAIRDKIKQKNGQVTAGDLSDELRQLDVLLATHSADKSPDAAKVLQLKAAIYRDVLKDTKTAGELIEQFKVQFGDTPYGKMVMKNYAAHMEALKHQAALAPGQSFPDFEAADIDGKPLSVGKFRGKVVLVDFWATWCGPCVHELPNVIAAYKKHHDEGFEVVGISLDGDKGKLDAYLQAHKDMAWPQYFDGLSWNNKIATKYGVQSIPFTVLVGKDGKIIATEVRGEALEPAIAQALAKM